MLSIAIVIVLSNITACYLIYLSAAFLAPSIQCPGHTTHNLSERCLLLFRAEQNVFPKQVLFYVQVRNQTFIIIINNNNKLIYLTIPSKRPADSKEHNVPDVHISYISTSFQMTGNQSKELLFVEPPLLCCKTYHYLLLGNKLTTVLVTSKNMWRLWNITGSLLIVFQVDIKPNRTKTRRSCGVLCIR